jgi:hypothetical protein
MKEMTTMKDRFRRQLADARLQRIEGRKRDLDARIERLKGELSAEREAREELASLVKDVGSPKKKVGLIRLAVIGAAAYILGARAGRQRYQQIMLKLREGSRGARGFVKRRISSRMAIPGPNGGMWTDRPDRSGMRDPEGVMMR